MVFDKYGPSLFDFQKRNRYQPFEMNQIAEIGYQLLESVAFMHDQTLIHTDLKPENILLVSSKYDHIPLSESTIMTHKWASSSSRSLEYYAERTTRVPQDTRIKVIDFGSATFEHQHHTKVVSTRHYRAPEVILGLGWTYPCDVWSIGCILIELFWGEALFITHRNLEHLAMMEKVLGTIPENILPKRSSKKYEKYFKHGQLRWPELATKTVDHGTKYTSRLESLETILHGYDDFYLLVRDMLQYDPKKRITTKEALNHSFFDKARAKFKSAASSTDSCKSMSFDIQKS